MTARTLQRERRPVPPPDAVAEVIASINKMTRPAAEMVGRDLGEIVAISKAHPELQSAAWSLWRALSHERRRGDTRHLIVLAERWAARAPLLGTEKQALLHLLYKAEATRRRNLRVAAQREREHAAFAASDWW